MTPTEAVKLCRFIAARCPAMRMQDETPDAWYVDLVEFDLADAIEAARRATLDKTFIGVGDLVRECRVIVNRREGARRLAEREAEIAAENRGDLHSRPVAALEVGKPVPADDPVRVERRQMLRKAAHTKRAAIEADTKAAAEHRERLAAARAELHPETTDA